jgi:hypothetical protein
MSDKEFAEFAAKVSNDIHENIDCRETRKQLREVISHFAVESCVQHSYRKLAESEIITLRLAVELLRPFAENNQSPEAKAARKVAEIALKL